MKKLTNMKKQPKRFKNHFDKFPPILREMVMEAMTEEEREEVYLGYGSNPLVCAFLWTSNNCLDDWDFWKAVEEDAIHHKVWE